MIQPKAFARVIDRASVAQGAFSSTPLKEQGRATVRQINRTPLVAVRKESLTQIISLPVITPAGTATAEPVVTRPEINQIGQTRQCTIVAVSQSMKLKSIAVLRQVFEPFTYIRVIPPTPPPSPWIDGGQFDDSHQRTMDGGQFGEENQPITDGGGF